MEDDEKREERESEFWRAQEQLHRQLQMASMLSGSDRTAAEKRAWDMYRGRRGL